MAFPRSHSHAAMKTHAWLNSYVHTRVEPTDCFIHTYNIQTVSQLVMSIVCGSSHDLADVRVAALYVQSSMYREME